MQEKPTIEDAIKRIEKREEELIRELRELSTYKQFLSQTLSELLPNRSAKNTTGIVARRKKSKCTTADAMEEVLRLNGRDMRIIEIWKQLQSRNFAGSKPNVYYVARADKRFVKRGSRYGLAECASEGEQRDKSEPQTENDSGAPRSAPES